MNAFELAGYSKEISDEAESLAQEISNNSGMSKRDAEQSILALLMQTR